MCSPCCVFLRKLEFIKQVYCQWLVIKNEMEKNCRFLTSLYIDKVFGHCEYLFQTKKILNEVCDYESQWGQVSRVKRKTFWSVVFF